MKQYITPDIDIWLSLKHFCLQTLCKRCPNHICVSKHYDCLILMETVIEIDRLNQVYHDAIDEEFGNREQYLAYVSQLPW